MLVAAGGSGAVSDMEDVFKGHDELARGPHPSQVRIYLLGKASLSAIDLSPALPDYELVFPRSSDEVALIRRISVESEGQFRLECERVAKILAPRIAGDSYLSCVYDDVQGRTRFRMDLQKTGGQEAFGASPAPDGE